QIGSSQFVGGGSKGRYRHAIPSSFDQQARASHVWRVIQSSGPLRYVIVDGKNVRDNPRSLLPHRAQFGLVLGHWLLALTQIANGSNDRSSGRSIQTRQLLANAAGVRAGCSPDDPLVVPSTESRRPAIPGGALLGAGNSPRSQGRDDSIIAHSVQHEQPDRRAGASRSLPSKDTGRGASPPWP